MEVTKFWTEHKALVIKTAVVVAVALVLIRFFNFILLGSVLVAIGVAGVLGWNHLSKKHGGAAGVWAWALKEIGIK